MQHKNSLILPAGEKSRYSTDPTRSCSFIHIPEEKGTFHDNQGVRFNCSMLLPTRQVNSKHCQAHSVINTVNCLVHLVAQFTVKEGRLMQEVSSTPITNVFFSCTCISWAQWVTSNLEWCNMQVANLSLAMAEKSGTYHQDHARPFKIALKYTLAKNC